MEWCLIKHTDNINFHCSSHMVILQSHLTVYNLWSSNGAVKKPEIRTHIHLNLGLGVKSVLHDLPMHHSTTISPYKYYV
jgi:hypothetical protein